MYNLIFAPAGSGGGSFYKLKPSAGSEIITDFLDPRERPVIPGIVRFENKLSGRVAIMAFKLGGNRSPVLFSYKKKELVRQTIEWLGKKHLPVFVKDIPNVFCIFNRSLSGGHGVATIISLIPTRSIRFRWMSLRIGSGQKLKFWRKTVNGNQPIPNLTIAR